MTVESPLALFVPGFYIGKRRLGQALDPVKGRDLGSSEVLTLILAGLPPIGGVVP